MMTTKQLIKWIMEPLNKKRVNQHIIFLNKIIFSFNKIFNVIKVKLAIDSKDN